ncbi:MAG: hypothetical protein JSV88_24270 [Candidatus Aminicenantes bacterium]|nr:MAG: hypothetical protein JSV88_24270 [Candidatus Aminicenantes bacterium]
MIKKYFSIQLFFPAGFSKAVNLLLLCVLVFCCSILIAEAASQPQPHPNMPYQEGEGQKKYPGGWDISIVPGTKLETLAKTYDQKIALLPADDLADQAPLPRWFRAFLREKLVGLPTKGRPQYPREAAELLSWLEKNQDFSRVQLDSRLERLRQKVDPVKIENKRRALYPAEWEVEVPAGTRLDKLRKQLDAEFNLLPEKDLEDTTPLPVWFRVYMRKQFPGLPKSGPYQYPRTANRILQRMLSHPDAD